MTHGHGPRVDPPGELTPVPEARGRSAEWAFWLAAGVILVTGAVLRMQTFTDLWTGVHNAWGGAFYGNVARNFLRYGAETAFAPVVNSGMVDPSEFEIYYHHPPLTMWLTGLSFLVFGVQEWAARLVPLVFSLATMMLVFEFARSAYGKAPALLALGVMAVLPVDAYYATHVDPNSSVSIFFTALTVEGYRRWLGSGANRHYALMLAGIVLGCMTGWFTYLVVPGIVLHGWLIHRPEERTAMLKRLWPLPAACVAVFGLFLLHRQIALAGGRMEVYDTLGDRLLIRTVSFGEDRVAIMTQYLREVWWLYRPPVVALSAAWLGLFAWDLWKGRLRATDWCILILWSYGLVYAFVFPGHLISHDFFVRTYAPGVAIASGVVLWRIAGALAERTGHPPVRGAVAGLVLAVVAVMGVGETRFLYGRDDATNGPLLAGIGETVAEVASPEVPVLIPTRDRVLQYYVDRPTTIAMDTPEKIEEAVSELTGPYLILFLNRYSNRYPELLSYLRNTYPEIQGPGVMMFRGPSTGPMSR